MANFKINVEVKGVDKLAKAFADISDANSSTEKLVRESMERIQLGAFKKAPVLTGLLSSTLLAPENVRVTKGKGNVQAELVESIPYATYQEFTNARKPAFIRTSTDEEYPVIMQSFSRWAKSLGKAAR